MYTKKHNKNLLEAFYMNVGAPILKNITINPSLRTKARRENKSTKTAVKPAIIGQAKSATIKFRGKNKEEKVSFSEGARLVLAGLWLKTEHLVSEVIKHPIKTLAIGAVTTGTLMALPLIGIPTAVGASAITITFGGLAIFRTGREIYSAVKNSKEEDNDGLRQDLKDIGGCTFDLAIALPFIPHSITNIKNQIKYSSGLSFNKKFWGNLRETKSFKNKYGEIKKMNANLANDANFRAEAHKGANKLKSKHSSTHTTSELLHANLHTQELK